MGYREFLDPKEINEWAEKHYSKFLNNPDEHIYDKVYEYTGNNYWAINQLLRQLPEKDEDELKESVNKDYWQDLDDSKKLRQYIREFVLPEDVIAYRAISGDGIKALFGRFFPTKGSCGKEKGFMSTSLLLSAARKFAKENGCGRVLKLFIPAGTHALYASQDKYKGNRLREYELLLPPGMKMSVRRNKIWTIECDVVETSNGD